MEEALARKSAIIINSFGRCWETSSYQSQCMKLADARGGVQNSKMNENTRAKSG